MDEEAGECPLLIAPFPLRSLASVAVEKIFRPKALEFERKMLANQELKNELKKKNEIKNEIKHILRSRMGTT